MISALTAGGRDDPIHTQVFHHLAVVVESVAAHAGGEAQARNFAFSEWTLDRLSEIFLVDTLHRFVHVNKRVL